MAGSPIHRILPAVTGDAYFDGLSSRVFWGTNTWNVPITYAFPDSKSDYGSYEGSNNELRYFKQFNDSQILHSKEILNSISEFTTAEFIEGDDHYANIRMAHSDTPGTFGQSAWAYFPFDEPTGGDLWVDRNQSRTSQDPIVGTEGYTILLHEIGHTMGLDHAHEKTHDTPRLAKKYDAMEYTVMSYKSYVDGPNKTTYDPLDSGPQTYMMMDIYALQKAYGADYSYNFGDNVYSWNPNQGNIFATLWDGGGVDTYDLSKYSTDMSIDIRPGKFSMFSQSQLADLGDGNFAQGNIYNALLQDENTRSMIENIVAGSGDDTLAGNRLDNTISGNAGGDFINGGVGNDTLTGGKGEDTFDFHDNSGNDVIKDFNRIDDMLFLGNLDFVASEQNDGVYLDFESGNTLFIENYSMWQFNNSSVYWSDIL